MTRQQSYRGLTWNHPRGYVALEQAARMAQAEGLYLVWDRQPLEGFESHPIETLAAEYDLIVLDHPHLGDAVSTNCLTPLDDVFTHSDIAQWQKQSIGQSFESYYYADKYWALPLDAAAQVSVARPDLLSYPIPKTWDDVLTLAERQPVCLTLAGPHALLVFYSISAAFGAPPVATDPTPFIGHVARYAWSVLERIYALSFKGWLDKNPIGILDHMSTYNLVVYCPLIFGYVNYAVPVQLSAYPIRFTNAPSGPDGLLGSTLGGTGIGISRRAVVCNALKKHLAELLSLDVQREFIPFADGQPCARDAWHDFAVNKRWHSFFTNTSATLESAFIRPRFPHYVPFQNKAAAIIRHALATSLPMQHALSALQSLFDAALPSPS